MAQELRQIGFKLTPGEVERKLVSRLHLSSMEADCFHSILTTSPTTSEVICTTVRSSDGATCESKNRYFKAPLISLRVEARSWSPAT